MESFVLSTFLEFRKSSVAPATFRTESGFWFDTSGMLASIGSTPLSSLSQPAGAASAFEAHLRLLQSRGCSPRTQALHRSAYLACLKHLHYVGLLPSLPPIRPIVARKADQLPIVPFTAPEVARLLAAASSPLHRALFALAVGVGLRPSEAVAARWEDFDFSSSNFKVRGTKTTVSATSIPLTALAAREMEEFQRLLQTTERFSYASQTRMSFSGSAHQAALLSKPLADEGGAPRAFDLKTSEVEAREAVKGGDWRA
ncbi:hypothetical protein TeGR_g10892, partial [Tetraparma gracilis]